jgi:hypothetical protein
VGIDELRLVDAGARDAACIVVDVHAVCTDSCQCPVEATCRLEDSEGRDKTCCRQGDQISGEECKSNCECVSGRCDVPGNMCQD